MIDRSGRSRAFVCSGLRWIGACVESQRAIEPCCLSALRTLTLAKAALLPLYARRKKTLYARCEVALR